MKRKWFGVVLACMVLLIVSQTSNVEVSAAAMKMNRSSKTLYLNEDNLTGTSDKYNFNIKNKPANYKQKYTFKWYAKDASIIDVGKAGYVTAKKVGRTQVICEISKKKTGKLYSRLSAVIVVKANAEEVTIKSEPENSTMNIDETFDFNRTMKAADGGKATDYTMWFSSDESILTIDKRGIATAHKTGTVEITCKTYQSAATLKKSGYTATSKPVTINVRNEIIAATPLTASEVIVELAVDDKWLQPKDIDVTDEDGNKVDVVVVMLSELDIRKPIIDFYGDLLPGMTYGISLKGALKKVYFTIDDVVPAHLVMSEESGVVGETHRLTPSFFNAKHESLPLIVSTSYKYRGYLFSPDQLWSEHNSQMCNRLEIEVLSGDATITRNNDYFLIRSDTVGVKKILFNYLSNNGVKLQYVHEFTFVGKPISVDPPKLKADVIYKITYDANGGTGTMNQAYVAEGSSFVLPACAFTAPAGKVFRGWSIGSADSNLVDAKSDHTFTASTTVYAVWVDRWTPQTVDTDKYTYEYIQEQTTVSGSAIFITDGNLTGSEDSAVYTGAAYKVVSDNWDETIVSYISDYIGNDEPADDYKSLFGAIKDMLSNCYSINYNDKDGIFRTVSVLDVASLTVDLPEGMFIANNGDKVYLKSIQVKCTLPEDAASSEYNEEYEFKIWQVLCE